MELIQKQYVVNERHKKVAVQIDLKTFEMIEEILENYALVQLMKKDENGAGLGLEDAKAYYQTLEKAS